MFPRVSPAVFASIRGAYASAESVDYLPELPEANLLALASYQPLTRWRPFRHPAVRVRHRLERAC